MLGRYLSRRRRPPNVPYSSSASLPHSPMRSGRQTSRFAHGAVRPCAAGYAPKRATFASPLAGSAAFLACEPARGDRYQHNGAPRRHPYRCGARAWRQHAGSLSVTPECLSCEQHLAMELHTAFDLLRGEF
jgi:hypothetical protein